MEDIVIKKVVGRCELRRFIKFPNKLFKGVPTYIPPLMGDELGLLTAKNPSLDHCNLQLWLAYRGKEIVGRVAGIINHSVNQRWSKKAARFGWFDFVEDYDVFSKLLNTVEEWGKAKGMDQVEGPFGFTDMDKECWVIEGYDQRQNISTLYNPKYYIDFIERAGYEITCRWAQYQIPASQPVPDKVARLNELILQKYQLKLLKFKSRKEVYPYARKFFLAINAAFKDLYDFVPLTDKEIDVYIKEYFPFINLEFANFVVDKDDNLVAFGLSIPDLNAAYKKANGRLFPFGFIHIMKALKKNDTLEALIMGVMPEYQQCGIPMLLFKYLHENCIKRGIKTIIMNPQLEENYKVQTLFGEYKTNPFMRRRAYRRHV